MSEPPEQPPINLKTKKTRTPEQLEVLSKAREKALQIRKENAKLRQAEKQIEKDKKSKELMMRKQKVAEYNNPKEISEPEPEPEPKEIKRISKEFQKKVEIKKEKKKKIIYVEESSESEEEEIVYVKKSKPKARELPQQPLEPQPKALPKSKGQMNYEQIYKNTFGKCREFQ